MFNRLAFGAGVNQAFLQLRSGYDVVGHQPIELGGLAPRGLAGPLHSLADGGCQGLAQLCDAFYFKSAKWLVALVVDNLQHTVQYVPVKNGRDQHLARSVPGALVDLFEKCQRRMDLLQRLIVVDISQIK